MLGDSQLKGFHHFCIVLVVIFTNVVQRLRFPYAAISTIITFVRYCTALFYLQSFPVEVKITAVMIMAGAAVFTLIANYSLEKQFRRTYLFSLRDQIRNDELNLLSQIDPLTRLKNRRGLELLMSEFWSETGAPIRPTCIALIDVDHFKSYNDNHGHLAGDQCLGAVADIIRGELRGTRHQAFRYGGEEFLLVLLDVRLEDGIAIVEQIRKAVEGSLKDRWSTQSFKAITVSAGVAYAEPEDQIEFELCISKADAALYAAKDAGRNRVMSLNDWEAQKIVCGG
ncbi:hypothetical protein Q669_20430 [Labrenzia sp. C1B10]|nr:hypothetical protein Q669_20430 [Labrenzia sp. C1B10]